MHEVVQLLFTVKTQFAGYRFPSLVKTNKEQSPEGE